MKRPFDSLDRLHQCLPMKILSSPIQRSINVFHFHFQVKRDPTTNQSRGYGFIRFREYDAQVMCLAERHFIDSRWCDVRIPISKVSTVFIPSELANH